MVAGGWVFDPGRWNGEADVWIGDGRIVAVVSPGVPPPSGSRCIDATGLLVVPGLVDLHVHLREPGFEYKKTIATGTAAAVAGGFTSVCCMPNTQPVNDSAEITRRILGHAKATGLAAVNPVGEITKKSQGREFTNVMELKEAGCVAVSDDGRPVMDDQVMRAAMKKAAAAGLPVIDHCEDLSLSGCGCMNDGPVSRALGLRGMPAMAEDRMVKRDILLAQETGARLHIAHVSTAGTVQAVRHAKAAGLPVTAEVCPHHFSLTEDIVGEQQANAKMNPPLRSQQDRAALIEGLADGTIDAIATDHAPHAEYEKQWGMDRAPYGIVGLETALGLAFRLVEDGVLSVESVIEKLTSAPARLFGLPKGTLAVGVQADVVLIDPHREWIVDPERFRSKGRNTPFAGWRLCGQVVRTLIGGKTVYHPPGKA